MKISKKLVFIILIYSLILLCFFAFKKVAVNLIANRNNQNNKKKFVVYDKLDLEQFYLTREENLFKNLDIRLEENSNDKLNEYVNFFNTNINQTTKNGINKVIFCDPRGSGYGNRIYTFFSCFIMALLNDSLVILTAWRESRDFIDLPFDPFFETNTSSYLNPNFEKEKIYVFEEEEVQNAWEVKKDLNSIMKFEIPKDRTRYFYGEYHCLFMIICTNPKHYDKLIYYNLVKKETIQKSIQTIENKHSTFEEKSHNLFMIGFEVGANLLNKIVIPKPRIQDIINDFVKRKFLDNYVIGIHLRTYYLDVEKDSFRFISCAFQIENEYLRAYKELYKPVKWFISSDSEDLIKKMVALYPEKTLYGNGTIKHVADDSHGYDRTLIDIDLLSKCDEIIYTGGSTFGFVAAMKGFKVPYYVDGRKNESICLRTSLGTSSQLPSGETVF